MQIIITIPDGQAKRVLDSAAAELGRPDEVRQGNGPNSHPVPNPETPEQFILRWIKGQIIEAVARGEGRKAACDAEESARQKVKQEIEIL